MSKAETKNTMSKRRLILPLQWHEGLLFDEKDTIHAYQILSRAKKVKCDDHAVTELPDQSVDLKLVPASFIQSAEDFVRAPRQSEVSLEPPPEGIAMEEGSF